MFVFLLRRCSRKHDIAVIAGNELLLLLHIHRCPRQQGAPGTAPHPAEFCPFPDLQIQPGDNEEFPLGQRDLGRCVLSPLEWFSTFPSVCILQDPEGFASVYGHVLHPQGEKMGTSHPQPWENPAWASFQGHGIME